MGDEKEIEEVKAEPIASPTEPPKGDDPPQVEESELEENPAAAAGTSVESD